MKTIRQGIDENRLHRVDFSDVISCEDDIATVDWVVDAGITTTGTDFGSDYAEIVAYGGTEGQTYRIKAVATTTGGEKFERSFLVQVVDR